MTILRCVHSENFGTRAGFDDRQGKVTAFAGQSPEDIHDEIMARLRLPDAIVARLQMQLFPRGSFDLAPEVLNAIEKGELQFTMDQKPYLQGYLSVINLYLLKRYNLTPTDINTGTVPVTWENVATVKELVTQGYR